MQYVWCIAGKRIDFYGKEGNKEQVEMTLEDGNKGICYIG